MLTLTTAHVERICRATRSNVGDKELFAGHPGDSDPWDLLPTYTLQKQIETLADESERSGAEFKRMCTLYSALTGTQMLSCNEVYDARTFDLYRGWLRRLEDRQVFALDPKRIDFTCDLPVHFKLYKTVNSILIPRIMTDNEGLAQIRVMVPKCAIEYMLRSEALRFREIRSQGFVDPSVALMIKEIVSAFAILNELRLPRVWWADTDRTHSLAGAYLIARSKKAQSQ